MGLKIDIGIDLPDSISMAFEQIQHKLYDFKETCIESQFKRRCLQISNE